MPESSQTRRARWVYNLVPAIRRTGMRITYIGSDWMEVKIKLPLNWKTRNYHGTLFGGSMYAAIDPAYLVMLSKILGKDYMVWDKAATIRFRKPAKTTMYATFLLDHEEINSIKSTLQQQKKVDRVYKVDLTDKNGIIHASFEKTLHILKKDS